MPSRGSVGILCALRPEISGLLRTAQTENLRRGALWRGDLEGVPLFFCRGGVGLKRAAAGARTLIEEAARTGGGDPGLSTLLCVGAAGGLDPRLRPGDIVVAKEVLGPKEDRPLGAPPFLVRLAQEAARANGLSLREGRLLSVPQPLVGPKEKARSFSAYRALAVDMESLGAARVAREIGVPFLALRVIADDARMTLPMPSGLSPHRLVIEGARFVAKVPRFRRALLNLNRFLAAFIVQLGLSPEWVRRPDEEVPSVQP